MTLQRSTLPPRLKPAYGLVLSTLKIVTVALAVALPTYIATCDHAASWREVDSLLGEVDVLKKQLARYESSVPTLVPNQAYSNINGIGGTAGVTSLVVGGDVVLTLDTHTPSDASIDASADAAPP